MLIVLSGDAGRGLLTEPDVDAEGGQVPVTGFGLELGGKPVTRFARQSSPTASPMTMPHRATGRTGPDGPAVSGQGSPRPISSGATASATTYSIASATEYEVRETEDAAVDADVLA